MYLTYSEYVEIGGSLTAAAFERFNFMAFATINYHTFERITLEIPVRKSVKMLAFELIDLFSKQADNTISSAGNEGVSVSYNCPSVDDFAVRQRDLIVSYLGSEKTSDGTPLLFQGV